MAKPINVTVWNEFWHEQHQAPIQAIYPNGIHAVIAQYLATQVDLDVVTATLDEPEHGLPNDLIERTDVLIWWSHVKHADVPDVLVERLYQRILSGMGVIFLHSSLESKLFKRLMGTSCQMKWREAHEKERLWVLKPGHPITEGIEEYFELPAEEMYGEYWDIPEPDAVVFMSWFEGGELFRSGITYTRGKGKIFYFRPGHEDYPTYYNENVLKVIENGVRWVAPLAITALITTGNVDSLEPIQGFLRNGRGEKRG
jgi:trehalose utilization protein